jgi:hypothetical protein
MKIKNYKKDLKLSVNDDMQKNYEYVLSEDYATNIDVIMKDAISPIDMLVMGVFSGKYLNDCQDEFPDEWFEKSKMSRITKDSHNDTTEYDKTHNFFGIRSRLSLSEWRQRNWIIEPDIRGWFQWWCRYYIGRRIPEVDKVQIKRWNSYKRHAFQVVKNARKENRQGDPTFRAKQRQSLLQWAHNPFPETNISIKKLVMKKLY